LVWYLLFLEGMFQTSPVPKSFFPGQTVLVAFFMFLGLMRVPGSLRFRAAWSSSHYGRWPASFFQLWSFQSFDNSTGTVLLFCWTVTSDFYLCCWFAHAHSDSHSTVLASTSTILLQRTHYKWNESIPFRTGNRVSEIDVVKADLTWDRRTALWKTGSIWCRRFTRIRNSAHTPIRSIATCSTTGAFAYIDAFSEHIVLGPAVGWLLWSP
jgi:hypothetical protein